HHRALHSFPTRRSSDLTLSAGRGSLSAFNPATGAIKRWNLPSSPSLTARPTTGASQNVAVDAEGGVWFDATGYLLYRFDPAIGRSEEHTSELQSPYDLV